MKVADLSTDELKTLIRETVAESLADLLSDPDAGLELNDDLRLQLLAQQETVASGERGESLSDVLENLGL